MRIAAEAAGPRSDGTRALAGALAAWYAEAMQCELPALYTDYAAWYPLLSAPADYAEEAAQLLALARTACEGPLHAVLELGAGGGSMASHYKPGLAVTLTDLSPAMLALSRARNPECEHLLGDMRGLRLGRSFDAVFVHDAIGYMTDAAMLRAALATVRAHLRPGGAVVLAPECTRESFTPGVAHGGRDADGRGLRYLEWVRDLDPADSTYQRDYALLLADGEQPLRCVHDRHDLGLFSRATWLHLLGDAGLAPRSLIHAEFVGERADVFVAVRPRA